MKKRHDLFWNIFFEIASFVGLVTPNIIFILINKDKYFVSPSSTIKITLGCIMALLFTIMLLLKKLKEVNGVIIMGIIWVIAYLLNSFIQDILYLIPCCIVGYILYMILNRIHQHYEEIYKVKRNEYIKEDIRKEFKDNNITEETRGIV